jgi:glycerophosphoryl diester phosphodiesterase
MLIAHRGESGDGANLPENTWQAELAAATEGATYLNMDVRWTSDGVPVALHDATVNRTTSEARADVPITDLTAQQYTALDARYYASDTRRRPGRPGVHPDTLAEVLAKIAPTGKPIVLQMEADPYQPDQAGATPLRTSRTSRRSSSSPVTPTR